MKEHSDLGQPPLDSDVADMRGDAWELGLAGEYERALEILGWIVEARPNDLVSLRMQGNILELKATDARKHSSERLTASDDYIAARRCYERIIELDPANATALLDLGDHYANLDAYQRALSYYQAATAALEKDHRPPSSEDDLRDLISRCEQLTQYELVRCDALSIIARCEATLAICFSPE